MVDLLSVSGDLSGDSGREESNDDIKLTLQSEVLFAKDSAELSGRAAARIAEVAKEIRENGPRKVTVRGFTDNLGTYAHGKTLSTKRAEVVHTSLAAELGGSGIAYEVAGKSEDDPIADNSTRAGRRTGGWRSRSGGGRRSRARSVYGSSPPGMHHGTQVSPAAFSAVCFETV
ncbi:OmpA family protein [Streptomyces sp. NPDC060010]|uniref:OmpA family protein n=1 Tax=Streptomyces sp. NPDC060010 TaxID=3347036 RepID=UPI0036829ABF